MLQSLVAYKLMLYVKMVEIIGLSGVLQHLGFGVYQAERDWFSFLSQRDGAYALVFFQSPLWGQRHAMQKIRSSFLRMKAAWFLLLVVGSGESLLIYVMSWCPVELCCCHTFAPWLVCW
jgi:hypothetical protein